MNLNQLEVFTHLCHTKNFTETAKQLHMTQPAVSHVIRDLEQELQLVLFDRIPRKVKVTEAGKQLCIQAEQMLQLALQMKQHKAIKSLRLGSSITIARQQLSSLLIQIKNLYPDLALTVLVESTAQIEEHLINNEIDLALLEGQITHDPLVCQPFSNYSLGIYCAKDHPLSSQSSITLKQLNEQTLLLREQGSAIRDVLDSAFQLHQLQAKPMITSVNSQALIELCSHGLGLTVLPDLLVEKNKLHRLELLDCPLYNAISVAWHPKKNVTDVMQTMLDLIQNESVHSK